MAQQTIAQKLKITKFPFRIKDDNGNDIYYENSDGYWNKSKYDEKGNVIYYESSNGKVIDKRPKCENKVVAQQTAVEWLIEQLTPSISLQQKHIDDLKDKANQMHKEQIMRTARQCHFEGVRQSAKTSEEYIAYGQQYYNETFNTKEK